MDSYWGSVTGYAFAPVFTDVYGLESQTVIAKHPNTSEDVIRLCAEQAVKAESYPTFDFGSVWQIDENALYPYPTGHLPKTAKPLILKTQPLQRTLLSMPCLSVQRRPIP